MIGRWPINVIIMQRGSKEIEFDKGAVITESKTLESGQKIEDKRLVLKNRKEKLPAPSFEFYWKDKKGNDNLILLEVERGIFCPVLPKYLIKDEQGNIVPVDTEKLIDVQRNELLPMQILIGHKYYDLHEELIRDLEVDPYTKKGFWEKYGTYILVALTIIGLVLVAGLIFMNINNALGNLTNMISTVAEKQVELIKTLKENITQQISPLR